MSMSLAVLGPDARAAFADAGRRLAPQGGTESLGPGSGELDSADAQSLRRLFELLESTDAVPLAGKFERGFLELYCELALLLGPEAFVFARSIPRVYRQLCEIAARHPNHHDSAHDSPMETLLYTFAISTFRVATRAQLAQWERDWSSPTARASFERAMHALRRT